MSDVKITITGPGLVVNGPALNVIAALQMIGFQVKYENWDGLEQWANYTPGEIDFHVRKVAPGMTVEVEVQPMPWGG